MPAPEAAAALQVHGKVNTIMLDGCRKVGLVFGSVVSTVELVNCSSCKVQCNTACPTLNIDKTDGAQARPAPAPRVPPTYCTAHAAVCVSMNHVCVSMSAGATR